MPASDPGMRRVSVHSGAIGADLALPAGLPVAVLIPSVVDILRLHDVDDPEARRYHLSPPGSSALDSSMTLAQNGVTDGAVLVLSRYPTPPPQIRYDDMAEAITATLHATPPWNRRASRLTGAVAAGCLTAIGALALVRNGFGANAGATAGVAALAGFVALLGSAFARRACRDPSAALALGLHATGFAVVAGFLAVPGTPGVANVLLAAMAAAVTSALGVRACGGGEPALTAASCVAVIVAVAAFAGVITASPPQALGSAAALVSLGLLGPAARISLVLAGLSPRPASSTSADDSEPCGESVAAKALRADNWLAGLHAAFSASAAAGAVVTVLAGAPRLCCGAFGALTGGLLLLRSRSVDGIRMLVFVITGIVVLGITFGVIALRTPEHGPSIVAVTAMLAAAAMYLGFVAPVMPLSPPLHRGVELLECAALIAMVPLTCWICGVYGAIRGLNLR